MASMDEPPALAPQPKPEPAISTTAKELSNEAPLSPMSPQILIPPLVVEPDASEPDAELATTSFSSLSRSPTEPIVGILMAPDHPLPAQRARRGSSVSFLDVASINSATDPADIVGPEPTLSKLFTTLRRHFDEHAVFAYVMPLALKIVDSSAALASGTSSTAVEGGSAGEIPTPERVIEDFIGNRGPEILSEALRSFGHSDVTLPTGNFIAALADLAALPAVTPTTRSELISAILDADLPQEIYQRLQKAAVNPSVPASMLNSIAHLCRLNPRLLSLFTTLGACETVVATLKETEGRRPKDSDYEIREAAFHAFVALQIDANNRQAMRGPATRQATREFTVLNKDGTRSVKPRVAIGNGSLRRGSVEKMRHSPPPAGDGSLPRRKSGDTVDLPGSPTTPMSGRRGSLARMFGKLLGGGSD